MSARADAQDIRRLSVDEFVDLPEEDGYRLELSRGRVVREPGPGPLHGYVAGRIFRTLWNFVEGDDLGLVFVDTAFTLSADDAIVRIPDVAFVASDHVPPEGITERFWELAPDLVVEVVSPSSRVSEMQEKITEYLGAGAGSVWVVDPSRRTVTVYRSRSEIRILEGDDVLEGEDALAGLRIPLPELFALP